MGVPFLSSNGGRLLLLSAACFLAASAWLVVSNNLYALGIGMPAGITIAFVGVGLSMHDYPRETVLSLLLLPPALWGFMYLVGEFTWAKSTTWGYGIGALAVLAVLKAAIPGNKEASA